MLKTKGNSEYVLHNKMIACLFCDRLSRIEYILFKVRTSVTFSKKIFKKSKQHSLKGWESLKFIIYREKIQ